MVKSRSEKRNIFDIIIIVLIASIFTGRIGGAWTLPRILTVVLVPVLLPRLSYLNNVYVRPVLLFFGIWTFYNILSLAWTPDINEGLKETVYFITYFVMFVELVSFAKMANCPYKSVLIGWLFVVLITGTIGMWELLTDNHLSVSTMGSEEMKYSEGELLRFLYASSTFGNYNTFVTVLCFSLPFILYAIYNGAYFSKSINVLLIIAFVESIIVIFYNGSRGGLVSLAIMTAIFIFHMQKNKRQRGGPNNKRLYYLLVITIIIGFVYMGDSLLSTIRFRATHSDLLKDNARSSIILDAMDIFFDTAGFGTGVGGLYETMKAKRALGETISSHNMFIELGVQYGILIFSIFLMFLYKLLKISINSLDRKRKMLFQMIVFSMPTTMVINSLYLMQSSFWLYFASVYIFAFLIGSYDFDSKKREL